MSNLPQTEEADRVAICFKASREFRISLDMVLAQKQTTVQDFCLEAVGRAITEFEAAARKRKAG